MQILAGSLLLIPSAFGASLGIFEDHTDVGTVLHAGSAVYDAAKQSYTISGSGENMWFATDAFHFVWKKMLGDVTLTADISFAGSGGEGHRKAVLMVRQSLDADSPYADVARHGDGLTSLQTRDERGANTAEIQSSMKGPTRVRLVKRGENFYIWVAAAGEPLHFSGGSMRIPIHDPFYVGLGVCSHNKDNVETAVFSKVEMSPELHSTVELVPVSGDRRAVYTAPGRISDASWTSDGSALIFRHDDELLQVDVAGGTPKPAATEPAKAAEPSPETKLPADGLANYSPHVSPDGQQIAFLSTDDEEVLLRVLSVKDGKVKVLAKFTGGKGSLDTPRWSPDSKRIAFVSYQWF